MKKSALFGILALGLSLVGCGNNTQDGLVWNSGYENCHINFVAESNLVIGLAETEFGALPSNTALTGNVTASPIFSETDSTLVSAKANVIAARTDDYKNDSAYANKINALCAELNSDTAKNFISTHYTGKVTSAYENLTNFSVDSITKGSGTITVVASQAPHAEILNAIKDQLKTDYGYDLSVTVQDWSIQNKTVSEGEADANYFQHVPYLNTFTPETGKAALSPIAKIHYEPLGVYKGGKATQDTFYNGATIEVCNDASNAQRALDLLVYQKYLKSYDLKKLGLEA